MRGEDELENDFESEGESHVDTADDDFDSPADDSPDETLGPSSAKGMIVTKSTLTEILGLAPVTVDRLFKEGGPVIQRGAKRLGWKINTADFISWLRRRDVANATGDPDGNSFDQAKRREKEAQAQLKEFELRRLKGETVTIEEAARIYAQEIASVRARLFAIPSACARDVAGVSDLAECERIIKEFITDALNELVEKPKPEDWKPDESRDEDDE